MVVDARALLSRTVEVIAEAKTHTRRSRELVHKSIEHVVWSDYLMGESQIMADQLHTVVDRIVTAERDNGARPEQVLMLLKGMVADAKAEKLGADARSLVEDVVRWGIESYYAA